MRHGIRTDIRAARPVRDSTHAATVCCIIVRQWSALLAALLPPQFPGAGCTLRQKTFPGSKVTNHDIGTCTHTHKKGPNYNRWRCNKGSSASVLPRAAESVESRQKRKGRRGETQSIQCKIDGGKTTYLRSPSTTFGFALELEGQQRLQNIKKSPSLTHTCGVSYICFVPGLHTYTSKVR